MTQAGVGAMRKTVIGQTVVYNYHGSDKPTRRMRSGHLVRLVPWQEEHRKVPMLSAGIGNEIKSDFQFGKVVQTET